MAQSVLLPALRPCVTRLPYILRSALRGITVLWPIALVLAPGRCAGDISPEALVAKYVRASAGLNITGRVLTVHPTPAEVQTTVRRVVRRSDGRSLCVFEAPQSERGIIIADDGRWTVRYSPLERLVRRKRSLDHAGLADIRRLTRLILTNYHVRVEATETVAGRACYRVCFAPKSGQNGTIRVWMDRATGAELRRDDLDASGSTVSLMLFTSVAFPARIGDAELTPRLPRNVRTVTMTRALVQTDVSALARAAGFPVRAPLTMPVGFHYVAGVAGTLAGRPAAFLRYTDGLLDLTLIETPRTRRGAQPARSLHVMPRPYGEVLVEIGLDDLQITLIGRGEPRELVAAAESLEADRESRWRKEVERVFNGRSRQVATLRSRGLSGEAVVALLTLAAQTGRSEGALLASYFDEWSWRELARRVGVPEAVVARRIQSLCACP